LNTISNTKYIMAFGKLRKFIDKIKSVGKKVFGGIKRVFNAVLPIAKKVAPMVATAVGGPGAGMATSTGLEVADQVINQGKPRPRGSSIWLTS
jgi:hypothetical protein